MIKSWECIDNKLFEWGKREKIKTINTFFYNLKKCNLYVAIKYKISINIKLSNSKLKYK